MPASIMRARMAGRRVHRRTKDEAVDPALLRLLCACALSAPSKSDLQQADIVIASKADQAIIADLIPDQPFIRTAPAFLVFLANGRRLPEIARMRGKPFPNDHLDQFFNAAVDAGIVLATFIARRRRGGARHLPDQCDPRPFRQGQRDAETAAAGDPGSRDVRRLAIRDGAYQRAARPYRARCMRENTTRATRRSASTLTTAAAPRSIRTSRAIRRAGATCRSTVGRRTRRGNTACRSERTSEASCGRRDSSWTRHANCFVAPRSHITLDGPNLLPCESDTKGAAMKLPRRKFLHLAAGAVALPFVSRFARAQDYPSRPVRVIVPFAPGGQTDVVARLIAQKLSDRLGKQFYVENAAGAGGNIGAGRAVQAAPDGYTILFIDAIGYVANPSLYAKVPYDPDQRLRCRRDRGDHDAGARRAIRRCPPRRCRSSWL